VQGSGPSPSVSSNLHSQFDPVLSQDDLGRFLIETNKLEIRVNIDFSASQSETKGMMSFPSGQVFLREFSTLSDAHLLASQIAADVSKEADAKKREMRLIEIGVTAAGSWVCGWLPAETKAQNEAIAHEFGLTLIDVDAKFMKAFLSLGPKPSADIRFIGMVEGEKIADVFRSAASYVAAGLNILELRVKRAGASGAYAYFEVSESDAALVDAIARGQDANAETNKTLKLLKIPLTGEHRRFFL